MFLIDIRGASAAPPGTTQTSGSQWGERLAFFLERELGVREFLDGVREFLDGVQVCPLQA